MKRFVCLSKINVMSKITTFSRTFPAYHAKKGQPTFFVEGILTQLGVEYTSDDYFEWLRENNIGINSTFLCAFWKGLVPNIPPKSHTIRDHKRPLKVAEFINPVCWASKPYNKTPEGYWQIKFAPDVEVKKTWDIRFVTEPDDRDSDWSFVDFKEKQYTAYGYGGYDEEIMVKLAKNDGLEIRDFYDWLLPVRTRKQKESEEPAKKHVKSTVGTHK